MARNWLGRLTHRIGTALSSAVVGLGAAIGRATRARRMALHGNRLGAMPGTALPFAPAVHGTLPAHYGTVDTTEYREAWIRPLTSWNADSLRAARSIADYGDMWAAADLCNELLGDDRIRSVITTRVHAITGADVTFEMAERGRKRKRAAREAEASTDWWEMIPEDEQALFIQWRLLLGVSLAELVWTEPNPAADPEKPETLAPIARIRNGRNVPRLKVWHPRALRYDWIERVWWVRMDGGYAERINPNDGKWILWTAGGLRPWNDGLWRGLAIMWLLKTYALSDWGRQSEKYANGVAVFDAPEGYDQEQRRNLSREWNELSANGAVYVPEGTKLTIFELKADSYGTFKAQVDLANTSYAITVLGANLPTEVSSGAGTGATAQQQVRADITEGDARAYETAEYYGLGRHWARANFGNPDVAPWAIRNVTPAADMAKMATAQQAASSAYRTWLDAGAPLDKVAFMQMVGAPVDAALVNQPTPPQFFAWHVDRGVVYLDEARASLNLPPMPNGAGQRTFLDVVGNGPGAANDTGVQDDEG